MDTEIPVLVQFEAGICTITLNRPAALNCLDPKMIGLIEAATGQLSRGERPEVRCVLIKANGRAFCTGADLVAIQKMAGGSETGTLEFRQQVCDVLHRLDQLPQPVIASVQGTVAAGGLELLLCCDFVVASRGVRFGDLHSNVGLMPTWGATARLPRRIGLSAASRLMFTGEFVDAEQMAIWGLVTDLVDADELETHARRLAETIASKSPLGLARMKRLMKTGLETKVCVALDAELEMAVVHQKSFDRKEGIDAFVQKRKPVFRGC